MQELKLFVSENELQGSRAQVNLDPLVAENVLSQFREVYEDFENLCVRAQRLSGLTMLEASAVAAKLRKEAAAIRKRSDKLKTLLKADALAYGKFVQSLHNGLLNSAKKAEGIFLQYEQAMFQKQQEEDLLLRQEREGDMPLPAGTDADLGLLSEAQYEEQWLKSLSAVDAGVAKAYIAELRAVIEFLPCPAGCEGVRRVLLDKLNEFEFAG